MSIDMTNLALSLRGPLLVADIKEFPITKAVANLTSIGAVAGLIRTLSEVTQDELENPEPPSGLTH